MNAVELIGAEQARLRRYADAAERDRRYRDADSFREQALALSWALGVLAAADDAAAATVPHDVVLDHPALATTLETRR